MPTTSQHPSELPLSELVRLCAEQTARFRARLQDDPRFCFDVFRRALCERSEPAWNAIYRQYESQVHSWVGTGYQARGALLEAGDIVSEAFARFWRAITADNFERFGSLKALLAYLQRCTVTALLDATRRQELEAGPLDTERKADTAAHDEPAEILDGIAQDELWQLIASLMNDDLELLVITASYAYGLPPAELVERWPERFPDADTVYRIKERILKRLARNERLRRFYDADE